MTKKNVHVAKNTEGNIVWKINCIVQSVTIIIINLLFLMIIAAIVCGANCITKLFIFIYVIELSACTACSKLELYSSDDFCLIFNIL